MKPSGVVTFLTDFGTRDPFVGVMKGVVLARFPDAKLIDLTHDIDPQDIAAGAFWLGQAYRWFPPGTVHVAVVDPGVGSARLPIAIAAGGHVFIGPDNGLFEVVLRKTAPAAPPAAPSPPICRAIDVAALGLSVPSRTFHGRDVFAPAAASLASGQRPFESLGPSATPLATNLVPRPRRRAAPAGAGNGAIAIDGEVVVIDRFGNLITNIELEPGEADPGSGPAGARVGETFVPFVATYADVPPGACAALINSSGHLEIARRNGSAASTLGAGRGTPVATEAVPRS